MNNDNVIRVLDCQATRHIRRNLSLCAMVALCFFFLPQLAPAAVGPNWIEQFGITWTFDKNISTDGATGTYQYGQFVNGDYWVIGPANIISINPPCHITIAGEKDEAGVAYNSYPNVTGNGAWTIADDWYRHTTIYTSDTSKLTVGQTLLINGTTGADSSKVNGYTGTVTTIYADRFVLDFYPERWDLTSSSVISGGTFGGIIINGSEINPLSTDAIQAYTSVSFGYTHSKNVAWGVSALKPLVVPVNSSLISTTGRVGDAASRSNVYRAQILTVLPSNAFSGLPNGVTPADCFRPHYFGTGLKKVLHYKTEMDNSFLGNLALVDEGWPPKPTLAAMTDQFARPWVRMGMSFESRFIHPYNNMPDYYFQMATNDGAKVLNSSDYTLAQKQPLLIGYVQLGIDLFGQYVEGSHGNPPDGGIYTGLMLPMLAFGRAFNYQPVWDMFTKAGDYRYSAKPGGGNYSDGDLPPDYNFIQELDQTFYVTQRDVDISNNLFRGVGEYLHGMPTWNPDTRTAPNDPYTVDMIGTPEWAIRQSTDPSQSDASCPQSNYRSLNSEHYPNMQLMVLVWGLKGKVNHNAWFDYTDRWVTYGGATNTWTAYRHLYGPIWPEKSSILYGDVSGDGQISAYDAALTAQAVVGLATLTADQAKAADVSGDKQITAYDAALIAQKVVGLIAKFPVEG